MNDNDEYGFTSFPEYKKKVKVLIGNNIKDLENKKYEFIKGHSVIDVKQPLDTVLFIFYVE